MRSATLRATFWSAAGVVLVVVLSSAFIFAGPVQAAGKSEVAVMPFVKGRDSANPGQALTCQFDRLFCAESDLKENAEQILTEIAQEKLAQRLGHRSVPLGMVRMAYDADRFERPEKTPLDAALVLGKDLKVDYVLAGNVWRYKERVGRAYGVEEPASVGFTLYLVNIENKKVIWRGMFNETQQSLSENLFRVREFFKRGGKWLTAEDLARYGMKGIMENFPVK